MSVVVKAQTEFLRLDDGHQAILLAKLGIAVTDIVVQAVDQGEQGLADAAAFNELGDALLALYPLRTAGLSHPVREELIGKRLHALFKAAEQSGVGPQFQAMWDEAMVAITTGPLRPSADSDT